MHPLLEKLDGGDRRSIGRSNEVVKEVLADPGLFAVLVEGLSIANPLVCMRASDALEKVSAKRPGYLLPHKNKLLDLAKNTTEKEMQWHMAQIIPRLNLNHAEKMDAIKTLLSYLSGNSSIVNTCVMQAFADIARTDAKLRPELLRHIQELTATGTPAMRARGKKLLLDEKPSA